MTIEYPERHLPERRFFNPETDEFITIPEITLKPMRLQLEHSLISIRTWESEHERPFTDLEEISGEELIGYIKCMTVNTQKDESVYDQLTADDANRVLQYITRVNSAWKIRKRKNPKGRKENRLNTVEGIYYAMIQYGIPFEPCEKWHLGSLMALIDYCMENGSGGGGAKEKPKSMRELRESWMKINEANRKKYHSRG